MLQVSLKKLPSINTKHMSNEDWLNIRQNSIGGSDAGTILGFNKYDSPLSLYSKKIGDLETEDISNKMPVKFGNYLEDFVAKCFEEETGKKVRNHNYMMYHPDYDFISANVDKVVIGENAILECKTASEFKKKDWADGNVPGSYMAQCYHYMLVTGVERVYIAVVFGNSTFHWTTIERDEEVIQSILEQEINFWQNHVQKRIPPEVDGSKATGEALNKLWKDTSDEEIKLDDKAELLKSWHAIRVQRERLDKEETEIKNKLKEIMEDKEKGTTENFKVTWKKQKRKSIDTKRLKKEHPDIADQYMKESESRVFKISEVN